TAIWRQRTSPPKETLSVPWPTLPTTQSPVAPPAADAWFTAGGKGVVTVERRSPPSAASRPSTNSTALLCAPSARERRVRVMLPPLLTVTCPPAPAPAATKSPP